MSSDQDLKQRVHTAYADVKDRVHDRIVGMEEVIDLLLIGILSEGHCLLVGVPGLAKTLLISTLSELLDDPRGHLLWAPAPRLRSGSSRSTRFMFLEGYFVPFTTLAFFSWITNVADIVFLLTTTKFSFRTHWKNSALKLRFAKIVLESWHSELTKL